jgi:hypothetical protein
MLQFMNSPQPHDEAGESDELELRLRAAEELLQQLEANVARLVAHLERRAKHALLLGVLRFAVAARP